MLVPDGKIVALAPCVIPVRASTHLGCVPGIDLYAQKLAIVLDRLQHPLTERHDALPLKEGRGIVYGIDERPPKVESGVGRNSWQM